jgi:hypothetical protein
LPKVVVVFDDEDVWDGCRHRLDGYGALALAVNRSRTCKYCTAPAG